MQVVCIWHLHSADTYVYILGIQELLQVAARVALSAALPPSPPHATGLLTKLFKKVCTVLLP